MRIDRVIAAPPRSPRGRWLWPACARPLLRGRDAALVRDVWW